MKNARRSVLEARVTVDYPGRPGVLRDLELSVQPGEITGLIGESGSGKSTLSLALMRLLDHKRARVSGRVVFEGCDLMSLREKEMRSIRGRRMALVLQSPHAAMNPMLRIGTHVREAWLAHRTAREDWKAAALPLFERVCLPTTDAFWKRYPREISVGQAQRVLIAMALLHGPALLIADEPTSALDVITQAEILRLFREINRELGVAVLMISHDLLSVSELCSRVSILESGNLVETGPVQQIFENPAHPYTRRLIDALPRPLWMRERSAVTLEA